MKFEDNKNWGYVEGDTFLHRLRPQGKIIATLFLLLGSGIGNGWSLVMVGLLAALGVIVARVPVRELLLGVRRMAWFFLAIAIFPVLFTPGFYVGLPSWLPISVSREGLTLALESSVRLVNILMVSMVLVRTTADWMEGLEKLLGPMTHRFPAIRDLLAVAVLSVKFLPVIIAETEEHFSSLLKEAQGKRGYQKIRSVIHSVLQIIVWIFSDIDRWSTENPFEPQMDRDRKPLFVNHPNPL